MKANFEGVVEDNYLDRNSGWLIPLIAGLLLATAPVLLEILEIKNPIPLWGSLFFAALGFCIAGLRSAFTDTFSAKVIRFLAGVFAVGMVILAIYKVLRLFF